jgi:hypothetical protein
MRDGKVIIDADGHYAEPPETIRTYMSAKYADRYQYIVEGGTDFHEIEGRRTPRVPSALGDLVSPRGMAPEEAHKRGRLWNEAEPGGHDPKERLKFHDVEGIDAAVLFPSLGLIYGSARDPGLAEELARATNRWLAEYCSAAPHELYGVANLPAQDPERASRELRRCVEEYGFVAGWFRPNPYPLADDSGFRPISDPSLDVLWATAAELDVPVCIHEGTVLAQPTVAQGRGAGYLLYHAAVHPLEMMLAFGSMFEGRVFDRFPTLRVGYMECNAAWVPWWLNRLDEHCEGFGWSLSQPIVRMPSEVFRDQCWVGGEAEEWGLGLAQEYVGDDRVFWASDYPHFDARAPGDNLPVVMERNDLSDAQKDGLVRRSSLVFYKLDEGRIRNAAETRRDTPDG